MEGVEMTTDEQRIASAQAQDYEVRALRFFAAAERCLYDSESTMGELLDGFARVTFSRNGRRWICEADEGRGNEPVRGSGGSIDMALADALTAQGEAMSAARDQASKRAQGKVT